MGTLAYACRVAKPPVRRGMRLSILAYSSPNILLTSKIRFWQFTNCLTFWDCVFTFFLYIEPVGIIKDKGMRWTNAITNGKHHKEF
jgi:hypothetical protein